MNDLEYLSGVELRVNQGFAWGERGESDRYRHIPIQSELTRLIAQRIHGHLNQDARVIEGFRPEAQRIVSHHHPQADCRGQQHSGSSEHPNRTPNHHGLTPPDSIRVPVDMLRMIRN